MMSTKKKPVQDLGVPKPEVPYRAGGKEQGDLANRKAALSDAGSIGYVPGHAGTGRGSSLRAGYVHEAPVTPAARPAVGELEPLAMRRPMPRETPVSSTPGHTGSYVRYLDGHTEVHRERPELVEMMNSPYTHPDDREDIRQELADRDAIHNHKYW
jgi:hypothetical protein